MNRLLLQITFLAVSPSLLGLAVAEENITMDGDVMIVRRNYGEDYPTISPDGNTLAICGDERLRFIDLHTKKLAAEFSKAPDTARRAHWLPSGKSIATIGDKIVFWSQMGQRLTEMIADEITPGGKPAYFNCMLFADDGKRMAIGFHQGEVLVTDLPGGTKRLALTDGHTEHVKCLAWGKGRLYSGGGFGDGSICVWDDNTGKLLDRFSPFDRETRAIAVHPNDGTLLAMGNHNDVVLLNPQDGKEIRRYSIDRSIEDGGLQPGSVGFLSSGKVVFATQGKNIQTWTLAGQPLTTLAGHNDWIRHAEVSRDGRLFVSAGGDSVRLYKTETFLREVTQSMNSRSKPIPSANHEGRPARTVDLNLLDAWEIVRGEWTQRDNAIIGKGNSRINTKRTFPNDFEFRCKLQVNGPTNPRVRFGSFHFGYEGDNQQFYLHGPKATGERFSFEFGRVYRIEVTMNNDQATLRIDGKLIATSNPKQSDERIFSIEAGGVRSQSSAVFSEMTVTLKQ